MSGILYTILGSQCNHWPTVCIYVLTTWHAHRYTLMYTWTTYCDIQSLFLTLIIRNAVWSGGFLIQIRLAHCKLQAVLTQKRGENSRSLRQTKWRLIATWRKLLWSCVTHSCILIGVYWTVCLTACLLWFSMLRMTSHLVAWICCCIFSPFSSVGEIRLSPPIDTHGAVILRRFCLSVLATDQNKSIAVEFFDLFSIALTCFEVC